MGDEVIKILNALCEKFGIAMDWSSQNIVPYIQLLSKRCVNYEIGTSIMWLVIGVIMIITGFLLIKYVLLNRKIIKEIKDGYCDIDDFSAICILVIVICLVFGIYLVIQETYDIITCFTFPEKIIFNQITEIYKSLK